MRFYGMINLQISKYSNASLAFSIFLILHQNFTYQPFTGLPHKIKYALGILGFYRHMWYLCRKHCEWSSIQYASADLILCGRPVDGWDMRCWCGLKKLEHAVEASPYLEIMVSKFKISISRATIKANYKIR